MIPVEFRTALEGVAREAALLAAGAPAMLLWRPQETALVAPSCWMRREGMQAAATACAAAGWPMVARASGGGVVPQGPFTLNLALVTPAPKGFSPQDGYQLICGALREALARFETPTDIGPVDGAFCDGAWNVTASGRKLAGTAQRWRAGPGGYTALIHAAILLARPDAGVWPALAQACAAAGLTAAPRPEAHVALEELLPKTMALRGVFGAVARAAEDRLTRLRSDRSKAA